MNRNTGTVAGLGLRSVKENSAVRQRTNAGYTMIEALMVLAIIGVMGAMAVPIVTNVMYSYRLTSAVSAVSGAISSTRFQAIMHGCPYQLVVNASPMSYQVLNEVPTTPTTPPSCLTSFSNSSSETPLPSWGLSISGSTYTYTFCSNGVVYGQPGASSTCPGSSSAPSLQILQVNNLGTVKSNTITVSGVGDVSVSSP